MQKPYKSIQIFKNPYLEKLTHVHPLIPMIVWTPISAWLLWRSLSIDQISPYLVGTLGVIGFFSWTLTEYLMHRFVFHFEAEGKLGQRIHFLIHGLHHVDPADPTRLVMPPILSLTLGVGLFSIYRMILGPLWVEPFFAFFILGYLCYDYIHYYVHHFTPRSRIGKFLKNSHMQHHYVDPSSRMGVSSPIWDYVFGTFEPSKEKERTAAH